MLNGNQKVFCILLLSTFNCISDLSFLLPLGPPDTGTSLLHQKLQMINCCIAKRQSKDISG